MVYYQSKIYGNDQNGTAFDYDLVLYSIDSRIERAVSAQEIINGNGAKLDDFGRKADPYNFKAAFIDDRESFPSVSIGEEIFALFRDSGEEFTFVHPSLGLKQVRVQTVDRSEGDEINSLDLTFSFIEEAITPETTVNVDVISKTEEGFSETIVESMNNFSDQIIGSYGTEGSDLMDLEIDENKTLYDQTASFGRNVRLLAKSLDTEINSLKGTLTTIENPANSLIAVVNYGTGVPGLVLSSIAQTAERYKEAFSALKDSPDKFIYSLQEGLSDLIEAFGGSSPVLIPLMEISAQTLASGAAESYELDQEQRVLLKKNESTASFDVNGNRINKETYSSDLSTLDEIERSLYSVREFIQNAINANRSSDPGGDFLGLKKSAEALLFHVSETKTEIDQVKIIEKKANNVPLHILLNEDGQNFKTAERTISLNNNIKNPTFINEDIKVYGNE